MVVFRPEQPALTRVGFFIPDLQDSGCPDLGDWVLQWLKHPVSPPLMPELLAFFGLGAAPKLVPRGPGCRWCFSEMVSVGVTMVRIPFPFRAVPEKRGWGRDPG